MIKLTAAQTIRSISASNSDKLHAAAVIDDMTAQAGIEKYGTKLSAIDAPLYFLTLNLLSAAIPEYIPQNPTTPPTNNHRISDNMNSEPFCRPVRVDESIFHLPSESISGGGGIRPGHVQVSTDSEEAGRLRFRRRFMCSGLAGPDRAPGPGRTALLPTLFIRISEFHPSRRCQWPQHGPGTGPGRAAWAPARSGSRQAASAVPWHPHVGLAVPAGRAAD
jgi:hypothetical protein